MRVAVTMTACGNWRSAALGRACCVADTKSNWISSGEHDEYVDVDECRVVDVGQNMQ